MKSYTNSLLYLSRLISEKIEDGDLNASLKLVSDCVERIITEPLCTAQVFGSKSLDLLCQRVGAANFLNIKNEIEQKSAIQGNRPVIVYIVTRLQKSGGHTRVIESFIEAQPWAKHVVLSTELFGRSDAQYFAGVSTRQLDIIYEQAPKENFQQRLTWLQMRLLRVQPQKIYLFNHHQDSVAVAAIQPEMGFDASFYHHGDHHLCLGVYLSHLKHIDPHPMGYHNCRDSLGISNTYIPLTIDDKGNRPSNLPFLHDGMLTTCTAARSNKIEIPYFISYLELIPSLLQTTRGKHIHFGRLTPWALFRIRRMLRCYGLPQDRFIYIPWVQSVWRALHQYQVDLYVASFPYGGGMTMIEAMGAGIPVALHRHVFSRILSGIDLGYSGVFTWRYPEELLSYCASITAKDLKEASNAGRMHFERFYSSEHLSQFIGEADAGGIVPKSQSDNFSVEADEWALGLESQFRLSRLISRTTYRIFRGLRAWWQSRL